MLGPYTISIVGGAIFKHKDGNLEIRNEAVKYTSDDKSFACRLVSFIFVGNLEEVDTNEDGTTKYIPEDYFIITALSGNERLLEIIKELNIAQDFPIACKTEKEAVDVCRKIFDYKKTPEA